MLPHPWPCVNTLLFSWPLLTAAFLPACVPILCKHSWQPPHLLPSTQSHLCLHELLSHGFISGALSRIPLSNMRLCPLLVSWQTAFKILLSVALGIFGVQSKHSWPGQAPAVMGTTRPSQGMREEGCSLCGFCAGPVCPPSVFEIGLCYSQLSAHVWHSQHNFTQGCFVGFSPQPD